MKYFKVFNTEDEYTEYIVSGITPNVSTLRDSSKTWINPVTRDYSKEYFTIESLEDNNTIKMVRNLDGGNFSEYVVDFSTDDGSTWTPLTLVSNSAHTYDVTTLNSGEKVMFKFVSGQFDRDNGSFTHFDSDGRFNVYGNITSLRASDFSGYTGESSLYIYLFKESKVVSAKDLVLPFQTVSTSGFSAMFSGCTYLTDAPELPATTLASNCYMEMFHGCTSLVTAPNLIATSVPLNAYRSMFYGCSNLVNVQSILPATTVGGSAYQSMFNSCTSLRTAPELSATTLGALCYAYMFQNCSSLVTAPSELPATTLANDCYREMFGDCISLTSVPSNYLPAMSVPQNAYRSMFCRTSLVVAPNLPATTLGTSAYTYMFGACTLLETAPTVLPALTAPNNAYQNMFINCSALTSAPEICATTVGNSACLNMFADCTSLSAAPTMHAATALGGSFKGAFSGCTSLVTAPSVLSATTLGNECYKEMFSGCKKLTTAPELPAANLSGATSCYAVMFSGCTSLTATPSSLPATTLANNCYQSMFQGCTGLTTAPTSLPAATLTDSCYYNMFQGCTSLSAAPEICATTVGTSSCRNMFSGCTGITTAQAVLPALTLANSSYYGMYERTNITTAPVICATTVDVDSCHSMFYLCSSLTTVQSVLPATTLADKCYHSMFLGCTNLTTAPELPALTLASECYRTMFSGCNKLNYIKCLATDISASNCTSAWVQNVASSGTFIKSSDITEQTWGRGGSGIPTNWVVYDDTHVSVTGVTLNTATATVDKGDTYTLTATVLPVNASVQTVTWSTSDSSVATVVDGVVTGVGCGNATITVTTTEGSYTAQCSVTVENHVTKVDLDTWLLTIHSGQTYQLTATVTPSDACNALVTWSTSDASIVTVTNGLVSGVTTGSATVTVTSVDTSSASCNCSVTVNEGQHVTGVTLSDNAITVNKDDTYALTATVMPNDAVDKSVTWTTSDASIATVDSNGVVSGVASGSATITVTTVDGGFTAQCSVSVTNIHDYSKDYFTIESLEDNNEVKIHRWGKTGNTEFYSLDNGTTWTQVPTGSSEITIATINSGKTVLIKSEAQEWARTWDSHNSLTCSKNYNVYGNIMSLTYGDDFIDKIEIKNPSNSGGTFMGLFWYTSLTAATAEGSTTLISAENLVLPATRLKSRVYNGMFRGCVNLQYPPKELPAITLVQECYSSMFELCRSLRVAPVIKAEGTAKSCCQRMFCMSRNGATAVDSALITAPVLLPKTLAEQSYQEMFAGNKNLNYIKCLATDISSNSALTNWVSSVSETGTFVKDLTMVSWGTGKSGIPSGWVVSDYVIKSFYISAATDSVVLFTNNLQYSYNNETWMALPSNANLNIQTDEKVYFKSIITPTSTNGIGHFNITGSVSVGGNPSSLMVGDGIESLNGYDYAFKGLLSGCTSITSASNLMMHKTLSTSCYEGMFCGCTNLTTAPKLPASTLVSDCYKEMFSGCTSLNYIEALFLTEPSTSYTNNWVSGVAASGEFKRDIEIEWDVESNRGVNGIPQSWNVGYGYFELGYIASTKTGGQYIDLDIKLYETLGQWYDIAIKYNVVGAGQDNNQPTLFGCQNQSSPWPGTFIRMNNNIATNTIGRYIGGNAKDKDLGFNNHTHELPVQTGSSKNVYNLNNSNQTHNFGTSLFCAFSNANNAPFKFIEAKLMYFKLFLKPDADTQGTLTRDMIPCKTSNGTVGLFDKVNNKLYVSPNGAVFEAGPEIN